MEGASSSRSIGADRKFQVFVSSTLEDLRDERRAVIEALLSLGHIPVGMELFQAGNDEQWEYIKRRVDESDYYIVIVAERYGSLTPEGVSYTEKEYRYALEREVPVAALLLDEKARAAWPQGKCEPEREEQVEAFRRLCKMKMVTYWTDAGDLSAKAVLAILGLVRDCPRTGWVSAAHAIPAEMPAELARLSSENDRLRHRVKELEERLSAAEVEGEPGLLSRIQHIRLQFDVTSAAKGDLDAITSHGKPSLWEEHLSGISALELLLAARGYLAVGATVWDVTESLRLILKRRHPDEPTYDDDSLCRQYLDNAVRALMVDLALNELVESNIVTIPGGMGSGGYQTIYWRLTASGKRLLAGHSAERKG